MANDRTRLPLPEPAAWLEHVTISSGNSSGPTKEWRVTQNPSTSAAPRRTLHTAAQMHAYSDAENAGLRAESQAMRAELIRAANFELDAGRVMNHERMLNGFEDLWAIEAGREALEQRVMKAEEQVALLAESRDCRTCARMYWTKQKGVIGCESPNYCVNGDSYDALPVVRLWRMT